MIEHAHVDQRQRIGQPARQLPVRLAWFGDTGGMVVGQDHRCSILRKGPLDHLPRVDAGAVDGGVEELLVGQGTMVGLEEKASEQLVRFVP